MARTKLRQDTKKLQHAKPRMPMDSGRAQVAAPVSAKDLSSNAHLDPCNFRKHFACVSRAIASGDVPSLGFRHARGKSIKGPIARKAEHQEQGAEVKGSGCRSGPSGEDTGDDRRGDDKSVE